MKLRLLATSLALGSVPVFAAEAPAAAPAVAPAASPTTELKQLVDRIQAKCDWRFVDF